MLNRRAMCHQWLRLLPHQQCNILTVVTWGWCWDHLVAKWLYCFCLIHTTSLKSLFVPDWSTRSFLNKRYVHTAHEAPTSVFCLRLSESSLQGCWYSSVHLHGQRRCLRKHSRFPSHGQPQRPSAGLCICWVSSTVPRLSQALGKHIFFFKWVRKRALTQKTRNSWVTNIELRRLVSFSSSWWWKKKHNLPLWGQFKPRQIRLILDCYTSRCLNVFYLYQLLCQDKILNQSIETLLSTISERVTQVD